MKENFNFNPSTPYAASKLAGELFLFTLHKKYNFPVVSSRAANVLWRASNKLYRIIPRSIIYMKMNKKIQLHGGGNSVRSFINIKDVSKATYKIISDGENGETYHLAPEKEDISIKELVKSISKKMNKNFDEAVEVMDENFGQDSQYSLNTDKITKELGFKTSIELDKGIDEVIAWINENWDEIKKQPLDYIHKK